MPSNGKHLPYKELANPNSPDWLKQRKTGIGSSEAAAAVGKSRWKEQTPLHVYLRKTGKLPEFEGNLHTRIGRAVEPEIKLLFSEETGLPVIDNLPLMRSSKNPFMLCTCDGFQGDTAIVECKNTTLGDDWGDDTEGDDVPTETLIQAQHQMSVTCRELVWVPVLINSRNFRVYRVQRCEDLIQWIVETERELWDRILDGSPPEAAYALEGASKAVNALYGYQVDAIGKELSPAGQRLAGRLTGLRESLKDLEREADEIKAQLLAELGTAEYGVVGDGTCLKRIHVKACEYMVKKQESITLRSVKMPKTLILSGEESP